MHLLKLFLAFVDCFLFCYRLFLFFLQIPQALGFFSITSPLKHLVNIVYLTKSFSNVAESTKTKLSAKFLAFIKFTGRF